MATAGELWDLLHEAAPHVPPSDLQERIQQALDSGDQDLKLNKVSWNGCGVMLVSATVALVCCSACVMQIYSCFSILGKTKSEVTQEEFELRCALIAQNRNEYRRDGAAERRKKMQPVETEKVVACSECDGDGKVTYEEDNPIVLNRLGNPGTFDCPICGGSGKLVEYESLGLSK